MASTASGSQPQTELGKRLEICPDPSVHEKAHQEKKLQEQSASAALYATRPESNTKANPLGPDGKLSSAGAATSLKYARAQDLPSYPSVGIDTKNSGLAAASIAHSNPKDVQYPAVDMNSDASFKAANLAAGYKMKPLWQPEASAAGSKAAMLAAQGKGRDWWQPSQSKDGLQAATLATQNKNLGPNIYQGNTPDGKNKALMAATLSVKSTGRKRSDSQPEPQLYPDQANSQANSLKAATSVSSRANEQARLTHARNLSRELYTEHPQGLEYQKQEKAHQEALRGASISMAKKMYAIEKVDDQGHVQLSAGQAAAKTADRSSTSSDKDLKTQALQYLTLQDAAQRLAAERLAKIEDQQESAAFQDYYGYSPKRRSRLSILGGRSRRRASSEGTGMSRRTVASQVSEEPQSPAMDPNVPHKRGNLDIDSDDEDMNQAARVRNQQNAFNAKLAAADKKRISDQQALLAAAERKVQAQMHRMDEKVFNETGKMSPAMIEEWDNKARQKAATASQARMVNHGKVNVGGGKFMDMSEVEAIARANVQPTLDEIQETAEKQRARDEEIRLDKEQQRREAQRDKERENEKKALAKRAKAEDREAEKAKKRDAKIAAESDKTAAKEAKQRDKDAAREEKQRERETAKANEDAAAESARLQQQKQREIERSSGDRPETPRKSTEYATPQRSVENASQKKQSTWKKLIPGRNADREPGKISKIMSTKAAEPEEEEKPEKGVSTPPDDFAAATGQSHEVQPSHQEKSVELTPTGATMAGDGPASIAAPEILPETEETIDKQATTPIEEHKVSPIEESTASRRTATEETEESAAPASPSKKRFSRIMGKLKRNKKDKTDDSAETSSFTGGAKLHKQRQDESRTTSESHPTTAAGGIPARDRSPSISSLSTSDGEQEEEERGRSSTRLDQVASHVAAIKDSDSDGEGEYEEARDKFDAELAPPKDLLSKKHAESPVRDSRFVENI